MSKGFYEATIRPTGTMRRGFFRRNDRERYTMTLYPTLATIAPVTIDVWARSDEEARAAAKVQLDRYNGFYEEDEAIRVRVQKVRA